MNVDRFGGRRLVEDEELTYTRDESGMVTLQRASDAKEEEPVARSLKCEECGKPLRTSQDMELHSARTKHTKFVESEDEIKPLEDAAKKEQVDRLQDLLVKKRLENMEKDRRELVMREKKRRSDGKEVSILKQHKEEFDRQKLMDDLKREKMQTKLARERALDAIRNDRIEKTEVDKVRNPTSSIQTTSTATAATSAPVDSFTEQNTGMQAEDNKEYSECKLLIRLPTGVNLKGDFKAKDTLATVRVFVKVKWQEASESIKLSTAFPKKIFEEEDMEVPLQALGLVPSAVLIVSK